jgi:hypothetical protein
VAQRTRIRRKDLRKPDQFVSTTGRFIVWLRAHSGVAIAGGGGVAALLAGLAIVAAVRSARQHDANADLARAMASLRATNLEAAAHELAEVARRWEGTTPAELAAILGAHTKLRLGNTDTALVEIRDLLDASGDLPTYLRQQLLVAWGDGLARKKSWQEAAAKYAEAASLEGPYGGQAILAQARATEAAGDQAGAEVLYRKFYDQFPEAPGRDLVEGKIEVGEAPAAAS